jgi:hypothetical protein
MRVAVLLLLLLTGACAERWQRPGASEAEGDAANAACADQATLAVPPQMVWQMVQPPRFVTDRQCWQDGNQTRCRNVSRYVPARFGFVDVSQAPRDAWRRTCMREKGFTFEGYRPLRLE